MKTLEKNKTKYKKRNSKYKKYLEETWNGIPATVKPILFEMTMREALSKSLIWHIISFLLICLLSVTLNILGITPKIFPKQKLTTKNIEFILPRRQRPKNVSDKEVLTTQNPLPNNVNTPAIPNITNNTASNTVISKSNQPASRPKSSNAISDFSIPIPSLKSLSTGLSSSGINRKHAEGTDTSHSTIAGTEGASSSATNGTINGSGFDKNATKKMIASYDISPYVNELRRNIQWNWKNPHTNKRVELFLRIAKDGRLIILNVKRTSEVGDVDDAALNAVKKCQPISPLPQKYPKSYLDVIFTFDANSVGSRY